MNLFQTIATFILRLFALWLAFSGALGLGCAFIGGSLRILFYSMYFSAYVERWPVDLLYLLAAWLIFRFSSPLGRRIGHDLGPIPSGA
jgi:hypothetical protein